MSKLKRAILDTPGSGIAHVKNCAWNTCSLLNAWKYVFEVQQSSEEIVVA